MYIVAIDICNGKKHTVFPKLRGTIPVPNIEIVDYNLIDIADDGFCTLMTESGATREDLKLPEGEVGDKIRAAFDDGKDILVNTMKAMNIEQIMGMKEL